MKNFYKRAFFYLLLLSNILGNAQNDFDNSKLFVKVNDNSSEVLTYSEDTSSATMRSNYPFITDYNIEKIEPLYKILTGESLSRYYVFNFNDTINIDSLINDLSQLSYIEYAEKVPIYYKDEIYDSQYDNQWNIPQVMHSCTWEDFPAQDPNHKIIIAVIDDAVDINHEDLAANIWTNDAELGGDEDNNNYVGDIHGWDFGNNDSSLLPDNADMEHGTHVSGIAGGVNNNYLGIASISDNRALIMPLKVGSPNHIGFDGVDIFHAIEYAIDKGANVINMSFSHAAPYQTVFDGSNTMHDILLSAKNAGIVLVATAGNNSEYLPRYPASYNDCVISVGSSNEYDEKSSFSNYYDDIDVMAPGSNIFSTLPNNTYGYKSGTSMAAPLVSGICAVMLSCNPNLTPDEVKTKLEAGCIYMGEYMGAGRVDFCSIMSEFSNEPVANFEANSDFICPSMNVIFNDISYGSPAVSWSWTITPAPASFTDNNDGSINVNFGNIGTYDVTLEVTDANGQSDAITKTIDVQDINVSVIADNFGSLCKDRNGYAFLKFEGTPPFSLTYLDNNNVSTTVNVDTYNYTLGVNTDYAGNFTYTITEISDANTCSKNMNLSINYTVTDCGCVSKANNMWYFGKNAAINFNGNTPQSFAGSDMNEEKGCASIANNNGDILFYTNGIKIWKYDNSIIDISSIDVVNDNQQVIIVPDPANSGNLNNNFYVIFIGTNTLSYTKLQVADINDNTSNISSLVEYSSIIENVTLANYITATKGNNNNIWIIVHGSNSNKWYVVNLDNNGFSYTEQSIGDSFFDNRLPIKLSPNGSILASSPKQNKIELFNFNKTNGSISFITSFEDNDFDETPLPNNYSIEFSPNNSKLYVVKHEKSFISQYDITVPPTDIFSTKNDLITSNIYNKLGELKLGPDNCIYYAKYKDDPINGIPVSDNTIGVIANPNDNNPVLIDNAVDLGSGTCKFGLPNNIDFYNFTTEAIASNTVSGQSCGSIVTTVLGGTPGYTYQWTGPNGFTANTANISGLEEGVYSYTVTDNNGCLALNQVEVGLIEPEEFIDYTCPGNSIELCTEHEYPTWNTNETTDCITIDQPGTYTCTYPKDACLVTDTYNVIDIYPEINITNIANANCSDGEVNIEITGGAEFNYNIESDNGYINSFSGSNNETITNLEPGTYTITVTNSLSCSATETFSIDTDCEMCLVMQDAIDFPTNSSQTSFSNVDYNIYNDLYVNNTLTFTNCNLHFYNNLYIVGDDNSLYLNNCNLYFEDGKGIFFNDKNELHSNDSKYTNACNGVWAGLKGEAYILTMDNDTLENAENGIIFEQRKMNIDNCFFINNKIDIGLNGSNSFQDYENIVSITNTIFTTNSTLPEPVVYPLYHIKMRKCSNAVIDNCTFKSEFPIYTSGSDFSDPFNPAVLFPIYHRGIGIFAEDAAFINKNSTFSKLQYAIKVSNEQNPDDGIIEITENNFNNNHRGVLLENTIDAQVLKNNFIVWNSMSGQMYAGANPQNSPELYPYGLYLNKSEDYIFEENYFESVSSPFGAYIGAYVNGSPAERIYNNTFSNFNANPYYSDGKSTALIVTGDNTNNGSVPIQIKCNDFGLKTDPNDPEAEITLPGNSYDIALIDAVINSNQGTQEFGNVKAPANNRFGQHYNNGSSFGNKALYRNNTSQHINYVVYEEQTTTDIANNNTANNMNVVNLEDLGTFNKDEACPELGSEPPIVVIVDADPVLFKSANTSSATITSVGQLGEVIDNFDNQKHDLQHELASKTDNGNTVLLLSKVQNVTIQEYDNLVDEITQTNGYVSDEVVNEFMKKNMNRPISKTIALRNVSPLPGEAKEKITETELNQSLKNYLEYFQNGISPRQQLEQQINIVNNRKNKLIYYAVKDVMLNDTSGRYINELINELQPRNYFYEQEQVLKLQKHIGNFTDAQNTINTLRRLATSELTPEQEQNINNWLDIEQLQIDIALADSSEKDSLIINNAGFLSTIAQNKEQKGQIKAQLLLESVGLAQFDEYTPLPVNEDAGKSADISKQKNKNINQTKDLLYIYPNPVNDKLTVEYALLSTNGINSLGIYTIKGKLIKTIPVKEQLGIIKINVNNLPDGAYFINFGTNGIGKYSKKFIVKH